MCMVISLSIANLFSFYWKRLDEQAQIASMVHFEKSGGPFIYYQKGDSSEYRKIYMLDIYRPPTL